jgi:hypothetical protein
VEKLRFEQSSSRIDQHVNAAEVIGGFVTGSARLIRIVRIGLHKLDLGPTSRDLLSGRHSAFQISTNERDPSRPSFRERNRGRQANP